MTNFIINTVTQEVHKVTCSWKPTVNDYDLGNFTYPSEAIRNAKTLGYLEADGCAYCCPQSHND